MDSKAKILASLYKAVDAFNDQQAARAQKLKKFPTTRLFGGNGALDSLGLVQFIVLAEQQVQKDFRASLALANEKALSMKNSPFRTIRSLADYIAKLLKT